MPALRLLRKRGACPLKEGFAGETAADLKLLEKVSRHTKVNI